MLLQFVAQVHSQLMTPCEFDKLCDGAQVIQQEAAALCQDVDDEEEDDVVGWSNQMERIIAFNH